MTITIRHTKGRHYAKYLSLVKLYYASLFLSRKTWLILFSENSKYELSSEDQKDWNKVIGRGGTEYKDGARKTEEFLVWRYNKDLKVFEVANYYRFNYKMILPKTWQTAHVGIPITVKRPVLSCRLPLGGYFGGNMPAPRNLTYKLIIR